MEQSYAETNVKKKKTSATIALKAVLITLIILIFGASIISGFRLLIMVGAAAVVALVWYWPRFHVEWEYVFCDGQLDFDMIQGGEKRKNVLRIEIGDADVVAPMDSERMAGYQHLNVRDYSSCRSDVRVYGIATKIEGKEEKVVIKFEPSDRMIEMMHTKCPNIVEKLPIV